MHYLYNFRSFLSCLPNKDCGTGTNFPQAAFTIICSYLCRLLLNSTILFCVPCLTCLWSSGLCCWSRTAWERSMPFRRSCTRVSWRDPPLPCPPGQSGCYVASTIPFCTVGLQCNSSKYVVITRSVYCVCVCVCVCVLREHSPTEPLRACRIHGHVYVNKVAGNFHVTVGK